MSSQIEYCVICGEALETVMANVVTNLKRKSGWSSGLEWMNYRITSCENKECPRVGLLTGRAWTTLEEAKTAREKFAKTKETA